MKAKNKILIEQNSINLILETLGFSIKNDIIYKDNKVVNFENGGVAKVSEFGAIKNNKIYSNKLTSLINLKLS